MGVIEISNHIALGCFGFEGGIGKSFITNHLLVPILNYMGYQVVLTVASSYLHTYLHTTEDDNVLQDINRGSVSQLNFIRQREDIDNVIRYVEEITSKKRRRKFAFVFDFQGGHRQNLMLEILLNIRDTYGIPLILPVVIDLRRARGENFDVYFRAYENLLREQGIESNLWFVNYAKISKIQLTDGRRIILVPEFRGLLTEAQKRGILLYELTKTLSISGYRDKGISLLAERYYLPFYVSVKKAMEEYFVEAGLAQVKKKGGYAWRI